MVATVPIVCFSRQFAVSNINSYIHVMLMSKLYCDKHCNLSLLSIILLYWLPQLQLPTPMPSMVREVALF